MKKISLLLLATTLTLLANDTYKLTYSKDSNCTLTKNGKQIDLFDKRLDSKAPKTTYTCAVMHKEHYNDCRVIDKKNIVAQYFGYGVYEKTNLVLGIMNPHESVESSIELDCTKELAKK